MEFPTSWPLTIQFLVAEQQKLERLPVVGGGLLTDADEVDVLCLQYAAKGEWPTLTAFDRDLVLQRFEWARRFCAALLHPFRKADGDETGRMCYPGWAFEPMMIWLLVEQWRLRESIQTDGNSPLLPRPQPSWPPGPEHN